MIVALKAEFRKLLTVRSTYVAVGLATEFVIFYAFYVVGWRLTGPELHDPNQLTNDVIGALNSLPMLFGSIIAILLMTHEYRYNTIMYTLTSSNSRTKVLLAKFLAVTGFAILFTVFIGVLSPVMAYLGVYAHGHTLVPQTIHFGDLFWRGLYYGWAYISLALLLAALIRNQLGAIVALFAVPPIEQLLGLVLKDNAGYLPFMLLNSVISDPVRGSLTHAHAAIIFSCYLVVGWLIAWMLFLKRDAN
ncbi:MAG: ABC transporter permease [Candidatus Saccharimonadales bacterium]